MTYRIFSLFSLMLILCSSCSKVPIIDSDWTEIQCPVNSNNVFWSVEFLNSDTGFVVGGQRYSESVLLRTYDAGSTWESFDPGFSKIIYDIQFLTPNLGMAVAYDGKIIKTENGGDSWSLFQHNIPNQGWQPIRALHMINSDTIFAVGGKGYNLGMIIKSNDGGSSWSTIWTGIELRDITFTSNNVGFTCGYGIIYKTQNAGETWEPLSFKGDFFTSIHFPTDQIGYVVGNQGMIAKTEDAGASWEVLNRDDKLFQKRRHFEKVSFQNSEIGYVTGKELIWKTDNGGQSWSQLNQLDFTKFNAIQVTSNGQVYSVGEAATIIRF